MLDYLPIVFSGVALASSIASPIITAYFNNQHQRQMFQWQKVEMHKANVIDQYIGAAAAIIRWHSTENEQEYSKALGQVLVFAPADLQKKLRSFDNDLNDSELSDLHKQSRLADVATELSHIYPKWEYKNSK